MLLAATAARAEVTFTAEQTLVLTWLAATRWAELSCKGVAQNRLEGITLLTEIGIDVSNPDQSQAMFKKIQEGIDFIDTKLVPKATVEALCFIMWSQYGPGGGQLLGGHRLLLGPKTN
jgi:hypothetical protein